MARGEPAVGTRRPAVCIVRHNYYPDSHVRRDAEALVEAGYDVSVIALRKPNQPARETLDGVEIYRQPVQHVRGNALRYIWEYTSFLALAFLAVTRLHLKKRFRVVEVDNMPDILVLSALVPKLLGARVILYIFDNMPDLLMDLWKVGPGHPVVRLLAFLERSSALLADRVVVTQEMPRRVIVARGVPNEKISIVLNCADERLFTRPEGVERDRPAAAFEIVTHGVMLERYGIQVLLEAVPLIAREVPGVRVQVFGAGEFRARLEEQARRLGIEDRIHFRGFVDFDELIRTLSLADAGYVGMLNDLVLPNKLMEYVTLGVPVLLSRWPTFEYYFPDAAYFFRPGDAADLARAAIDLYRDPQRAGMIARQAAALYARYRWPIQRERYLSVYEDLQNPRRPRPTALPGPESAAR